MKYLQAKAELMKPAAKPSFKNLALEGSVMVLVAYGLLQLFGG